MIGPATVEATAMQTAARGVFAYFFAGTDEAQRGEAALTYAAAVQYRHVEAWNQVHGALSLCARQLAIDATWVAATVQIWRDRMLSESAVEALYDGYRAFLKASLGDVPSIPFLTNLAASCHQALWYAERSAPKMAEQLAAELMLALMVDLEPVVIDEPH